MCSSSSSVGFGSTGARVTVVTKPTFFDVASGYFIPAKIAAVFTFNVMFVQRSRACPPGGSERAPAHVLWHMGPFGEFREDVFKFKFSGIGSTWAKLTVVTKSTFSVWRHACSYLLISQPVLRSPFFGVRVHGDHVDRCHPSHSSWMWGIAFSDLLGSHGVLLSASCSVSTRRLHLFSEV